MRGMDSAGLRYDTVDFATSRRTCAEILTSVIIHDQRTTTILDAMYLSRYKLDL